MNILLVITLFLLQFGCTSQDSNFPPVRQSFVKIEKLIEVEVCSKPKKKRKKKCKTMEFQSSGSGSVVDVSSTGSFVLTAAHVCDGAGPFGNLKEFIGRVLGISKDYTYKAKDSTKVIDIDARKYPAEGIGVGKEHDLCIMFVEEMNKHKPLERYYGELEIGTIVYNMAAPLGMHEKDFMPLFRGVYSGEEDKNSIYTIPVRGGSSGSPVLDGKGRLVGMTHSTIMEFMHISRSPPLKDMNEFIDNTLKEYRKKWYNNLWKISRPKGE